MNVASLSLFIGLGRNSARRNAGMIGTQSKSGKPVNTIAEQQETQTELLTKIHQENTRLKHNLAALRDRIGSLGELGEEMRDMNRRVSDGLFR